ncbi:MAG TPA: site-2 protease family protein [Verrucomicrobiae bacterium]|nr:site-2 protease family protein [Verrucomicrobiae bacterium]
MNRKASREEGMKWSWRVATMAGIGIYVHVTFLLLIFFAGWKGYSVQQKASDALWYIAFTLTLFFIVVLHELGHALAARRYGIGTRDITLLPIGGVARLERMPEKPRQELVVALAGPAVNVVLAILIGAGMMLAARFSSGEQVLSAGRGFITGLLYVNIVLVVFNLLPAFPMDGGRVLRALLAIRMDYVRATQIAANIGQGMAFIFGMLGLLGFMGGPMNPLLILIAVFVWMGAAQESNMVQVKSALGHTRVGQLMITDFRTLAPEDTLSRAVDLLLTTHQQDFPVVVSGRVVGVLTRSALVQGLARLGSQLPVADAMEQQFQTADADDLVEAVFTRLQGPTLRSMPVLWNGQLAGMITAENVGEYLMIEAALHNDPNERRNLMPAGRVQFADK